MKKADVDRTYAKAELLIRQLGIGGTLSGHYYLITGIADYSLRRYPLSAAHVMFGWIAAKHGTTKEAVRKLCIYAYRLMRKRNPSLLEAVLGHPPTDKPHVQELLVCCSEWIDIHEFNAENSCWVSTDGTLTTITFPISG